MERRSQSLYDVCSEARIAEERNAMKQFIAKFADQVDGILCGFDRLVMRGELRALYIANGGGIEQYFRSSGLMFKDFGAHVERVSRRLKEASLAAAVELGRVVRYVPSAAAAQAGIPITLSFSGTGTEGVGTASGTLSPFGAATADMTTVYGTQSFTVFFTFHFNNGDTLTADRKSV